MHAGPLQPSTLATRVRPTAVPYVEAFVGQRDVLVTCHLADLTHAPTVVARSRRLSFPGLGFAIDLPVDVDDDVLAARLLNGIVDVRLRRATTASRP